MRLEVYLALAAAIGASLLLPSAARRLAPRPASFLLALGGLGSAVLWTAGLALLAASLIGRLPLAGYVGHWSAKVFAAREPVPPAIGVVGLALLVVSALAVVWAVARLVPEVTRIYRLHRDATPVRCGDVAVVEAVQPAAVALPGWRGSIVLTSAMVQALDPAERRVLLAHERCHLRNRHWLFRLAIRLATALLPTLRPAIGQCDQALERWADEDSADAVGDRQLAAAAVAKAALAGAAAGRAKLAAGFSNGLVAARVEALLEEPIPHRSAPLALPTAALLIATVAVLSAASTLEDLFELARHL